MSVCVLLLIKRVIWKYLHKIQVKKTSSWPWMLGWSHEKPCSSRQKVDNQVLLSPVLASVYPYIISLCAVYLMTWDSSIYTLHWNSIFWLIPSILKHLTLTNVSLRSSVLPWLVFLLMWLSDHCYFSIIKHC